MPNLGPIAEVLIAVLVAVVIVKLTHAILSQPETGSRAVDADVKPQTYQALITHWNQQNTLLWSRVQTLLALQVAVLAYLISTATPWKLETFLVGVLGAIVTIVLSCIVDSDRRARDANLETRSSNLVASFADCWIR